MLAMTKTSASTLNTSNQTFIGKDGACLRPHEDPLKRFNPFAKRTFRDCAR